MAVAVAAMLVVAAVAAVFDRRTPRFGVEGP